jgi:UDPglucose--hexose-1-phosphate uridylyltransferase
MELERYVLEAMMVEPGSDAEVRTQIELRIDPLTGHSSRILPQRGLMPPSDLDLPGLARKTAATCPFCPERIEHSTPRLPSSIAASGRIVRGDAVLFPNLHAYASHSTVSVYSVRRHYLPLEQMSARLMADNLATQVEFAGTVMRLDPGLRWASINANHMLPSGSSLFHPHLQGLVDEYPTTLQRLLATVPPARFESYLAAERRAGERYLADTGRIQWLACFAPIAPAELRAFIADCASPAEMDSELTEELAHGLELALAAYAELGFQSFNLAIYGAPPETAGYPLNLRLACRSNLAPLYRSDSTFLERLHWEGAIDIAPESLAARIRDRFRR